MELQEIRAFNGPLQEGQAFEIKLFASVTAYHVIAFLGGVQVSPIYTVNFELNENYFKDHQDRMIENLFELAEADIDHKLYFHTGKAAVSHAPGSIVSY